MSDVSDIAAVTIWWNGLCMEELARPKNVEKADWRNVDVESYMEAATGNMEEARDALAAGDTGTFIGRCTDICNLLMLAGAVRSNDVGHTGF